VYSAGQDSWSVEESAQMADGPTGCGEVRRVWEFIRLELPCDKVSCTEAEGSLGQIRRSCCISDSLLAYSSKIPPATNRVLHYTKLFPRKCSSVGLSLTMMLLVSYAVGWRDSKANYCVEMKRINWLVGWMDG